MNAIILILGLAFASPQYLFKIYKAEHILEVWSAKGKIAEYPICRLSGDLGPKEKQGDLQVPEGIYRVVLLNPKSAYTLSAKINYPNAYDKLLGRTGGDIYIHGSCVSIGCISMSNHIYEIYELCKTKPLVYIFPFKREKFKTEGYFYPQFQNFWKKLFELEDLFKQGIVYTDYHDFICGGSSSSLRTEVSTFSKE